MTGTDEPVVTGPVPARRDAEYAAVIVPLDGSDDAERALGTAELLAAAFGVGLHAVIGGVRRDEAWWYQGYADRLRERPVAVDPHLSDDQDVVAAIIAAARTAGPSLVCMATHGRSRAAAIVGSTFAGVATRNPTPLVAVGPRAGTHGTARLDRVVVCLDGSPVAEGAIDLAAAWAGRLQMGVTLLTAADPALVRRGKPGDPTAYLSETAERPALDGIAVETQVLWGPGYPHTTIGEHLDQHPTGIVVATSHARTGLARAALGSEVARIIHRSPWPVLVQPLRHA
jgi:nucleotide-binding universal stress UspA family protein